MSKVMEERIFEEKKEIAEKLLGLGKLTEKEIAEAVGVPEDVVSEVSKKN